MSAPDEDDSIPLPLTVACEAVPTSAPKNNKRGGGGKDDGE